MFRVISQFCSVHPQGSTLQPVLRALGGALDHARYAASWPRLPHPLRPACPLNPGNFNMSPSAAADSGSQRSCQAKHGPGPGHLFCFGAAKSADPSERNKQNKAEHFSATERGGRLPAFLDGLSAGGGQLEGTSLMSSRKRAPSGAVSSKVISKIPSEVSFSLFKSRSFPNWILNSLETADQLPEGRKSVD